MLSIWKPCTKHSFSCVTDQLPDFRFHLPAANHIQTQIQKQIHVTAIAIVEQSKWSKIVQMVQGFVPECVLKCIRKSPAWIDALLAFVWLCSRVSLHVSSQINCLNTCKVTLHAFVRLFSKVNFDMSSQTTCISGCIVPYVAFVRFCSRVSFLVNPQVACIIERLLTILTRNH